MRRIIGAAGFVALGLALMPSAARADVNFNNATTAWRQADQCAHAALQKYPDYTPESNAKREAARLACLRDHRLPAPTAAVAPGTGSPNP